MFSTDSVLYQWLNKLANLVFLNVLWIICCIPVITAGAATTAMYSVLLKMVRDEESYVVRDYFRSFKRNLAQATAVWVLVLLYVGVILGQLFFLTHTQLLGKPFLAAAGIFAVFFLMTVTYVFPVMAFFDDTVKVSIKNAFLMSLENLPVTFLMIGVHFLPILVLWFFSAFIKIASFAVVVIGFSFCAWINAHFLRKIFGRHMPEKISGTEI